MIKKTSTSLTLLILANAVPLGGVLFFEWSLFAVLFFYWLETVVVGILNIPKMIMAKGMDEKLKEGLAQLPESKRGAAYIAVRMFTIPFFIVHFGMFVAGHGFFVFSLYGPSDVGLLEVLLALGTFLCSHGYSFLKNFVGNQEYLLRSINQQMAQPYKRVVILHIAIVFGAFPLMVFESSLSTVFILILLKTVLDVILHMREHGERKKIHV